MSFLVSTMLDLTCRAGTGTTAESVKHCILTLRRLLYPNYAVIPIEEHTLLKEPWAPGCALFVIPGGADLGYCRVLNGAGNRLISRYVRNGGRYLGLCAGGYYGTNRCEFEVGDQALEVIGARELAFFPGTCRGAAFKGFRYASEIGARAAKLSLNLDALPGSENLTPSVCCYYNGGGVFVDAEGMAGAEVEVLASYEDDVALGADSGKAGVVYCKAGNGAAILTGPHPEYVAPHTSARSD